MDAAPPAPPIEQLRWSALSDRGKVRRNNEDSFVGMQFDAREMHRLGKIGETSLASADLVFAVSDGMGGAQGGGFASRSAAGRAPRAPAGEGGATAPGRRSFGLRRRRRRGRRKGGRVPQPHRGR